MISKSPENSEFAEAPRFQRLFAWELPNKIRQADLLLRIGEIAYSPWISTVVKKPKLQTIIIVYEFGLFTTVLI